MDAVLPILALSRRLKEVRKRLGLRQKDFAVRTEIPLGTLEQYETGRIAPSSLVLLKYAALGVDLHWLLTGENKSEATFTKDFLRPRAPKPLPVYAFDKGVGSEPLIWLDSRLHASIDERRHLDGSPILLALMMPDDSMEPTIRQGALTIIIPLKHDAQIGDGLYAITGLKCPTIRRVQADADANLTLVADNMEAPYKPIALRDNGSVNIAGRIASQISWLD
ncbi:MAG: helix-turn-helix domain-containing protein [Dongiaceae bacterium]